MKRFQEIDAARKLLMLPEQATLEDIKASFRDGVREWHPDRGQHAAKQCTEMTAKMVAAYRTLMDYCSRYHYSFSAEAVKQTMSEDDWWFERFGEDPVWGK